MHISLSGWNTSKPSRPIILAISCLQLILVVNYEYSIHVCYSYNIYEAKNLLTANNKKINLFTKPTQKR